jgi:hypothetical protein
MKTAIFSARDFFVVLFRSCCAVFVGFLARGFVPMQELFPVFTGLFGLLRFIFINSFIHQKKKIKKKSRLGISYSIDLFLELEQNIEAFGK